LSYSFEGKTSAQLQDITTNLGTRWTFLETLYRIYSTAGYNIAHVDVTAQLCQEHDIQVADIERIEAVVNWLETQYPSPAYPDPARATGPVVGSTQYFSAYGAAKRGFPFLKVAGDRADPPEVLDLMHRVTLIASHAQPLFAPTVTIYMKDGKSHTRTASGREFIWDFDEEVRRLDGITEGIPISTKQFDDLVAACRGLETLERADQLIALTLT